MDTVSQGPEASLGTSSMQYHEAQLRKSDGRCCGVVETSREAFLHKIYTWVVSRFMRSWVSGKSSSIMSGCGCFASHGPTQHRIHRIATEVT